MLGPDEWVRFQWLLGKQQSGHHLTWAEGEELRQLIAKQGYTTEAQKDNLRKLGMLGLGIVAAWLLTRKK